MKILLALLKSKEDDCEKIAGSVRELLNTVDKNVELSIIIITTAVDDTRQLAAMLKGLSGRNPIEIIPCYSTEWGYLWRFAGACALRRDMDYVALLHFVDLLECTDVALQPLNHFTTNAGSNSAFVTKRKFSAHLFNLFGLSGRIFALLTKFVINNTFGKQYSDLHLYNPVMIPVKSLRAIPLGLIRDNHFAAYELLLQLTLTGSHFRVMEKGITNPGTLNLKTLFFIVQEIIKINLSMKGLLYRPRYDISVDNRYYPPKLNFPSTHSFALNTIKKGDSVLDLGSGPVPVSYYAAEKAGKIVTVDQYPPEKPMTGAEFIVDNLNDDLSFPVKGYNIILLLDIIEHLYDPEKFLRQLAEQFENDKQTIIFTTANIAFLPQRLTLLLGAFNYGKKGILDKTHTRLFTFRTFSELIRRSGMKIEKVRGVPVPFPLAFGDNRFSRFLIWINILLIMVSKNIFSFQIFIQARSVPSVTNQIAKGVKV